MARLKAWTLLNLFFFAFLPCFVQEAQARPLKTVVQINSKEPEAVIGALRNVQNISETAQADSSNLEVRLIVYGSALKFFEKTTKGELLERFNALQKNPSVHFYACEHTLKRTNKQVSDLLPGFKTVPSGAYEILRLQTRGYVYYRP